MVVAGEAADGEEAVKRTLRLRPDMLLLDLRMPRVSGMEAMRELAASSSATRINLLTASIGREQILEALQLGARGIVLKASGPTPAAPSLNTHG